MKGIGLMGETIARADGDGAFLALLVLGILILCAFAVERNWF